jgi:hypothetical protein
MKMIVSFSTPGNADDGIHRDGAEKARKTQLLIVCT